MSQSQPIHPANTDELLTTKLALPRLYSLVVPRELVRARLDEGQGMERDPYAHRPWFGLWLEKLADA